MTVESEWSIGDSVSTYGIDRWSRGMFGVNERGHVVLRETRGDRDIDMKELVDEIRLRGMNLPVLFRFTDILERRLEELAGAFARAAAARGYRGAYRGVYPIKVNQHRHVLDDVIARGRKHHFGLEAGSKSELMVAIAYLDDPEALLICNGFKDRDYLETALAARRLGLRIILVVEKFSELPFILEVARAMGVEPLLGLRMKLSSSGGGKWRASSGDRSKFGLHAAEIVEAIQLLKRRKQLPALQLLHFHVGSQVPDIQLIKDALREATSVFVEVCKMGAPIRYMDVGGGLAVDYDGSHSNFASSANYDIDEYADDVTEALALACEEADLPHPTIVNESGRAIAAHHAVLVFEALSAQVPAEDMEPPHLPKRAPYLVRRMGQLLDELSRDSVLGTYHDAIHLRREALLLFNLRHLSLANRARIERTFKVLCHRIALLVPEMAFVPEELDDLEDLLAVTYFCNFSLFQSLPDHWAIKQLFPVVPLHRLDERPTQRAVIADITCDSDGAMDRFIDLEDVGKTLSLHKLRDGEPYYLGVFLVGAYQEVLGDLHNLFGDTNVVHVSSGKRGYVVDKTVEGDSTVDVLGYLQYNRRQLLAKLRRRVEDALDRGAMPLEQSAPFMRDMEARLDDYTYLSSAGADAPRRSR